MRRKGFTLIELVVTIAILGVLMIIAIPSVRYIQTNNKNAKYEAYGKAITAAGKAYTDGYHEDLFGITNSGCAIISYNDLESKDLIENIQLQNTNCGNNDTCVVVKKSKAGNYNYETRLTCRSNGNIIYKTENNSCDPSACLLEEVGKASSAPIITAWDEGPYASKPYYKLFSEPKVKIKIEDKGVGLKENQKLHYQWYQDNTIISNGSGTIYFKNKNYQSSVVRDVPLPPGIGTVTTKDVTYKVVFSGTVEDIDNNKNSSGKDLSVKYHIERVIIKLNANGGSLVNPHGAGISLNSNEDVIYTTSNNTTTMHTILMNTRSGDYLDGSLDSNGLLDWSYTGWLNLRKSGYTVKEWNTNKDGSGKAYNQNTAYKASDFCDITKGDCEVRLYAIWRINVCTINYSPNGGSFGTNASTKQTLNYGQSITDMPNAKGGTYSATNSYKYPKPTEEWINGSYIYNEAKGYSATQICTNLANADQSVTLSVNWFYENCRPGYIIPNQTLTKEIRAKVKKAESANNIVDVRTFHWSDPDESCGSKPYKRQYKFKEYGCSCNIDKNTRVYCSVNQVEDYTKETHSKGHATIYYYGSDEGQDACKANINVNSYVKEVCQNGAYDSGKDYMVFHGYFFYKGAVGDHNNFAPSSYWTHSGKNWEDRIVSSASKEDACAKACATNFP